MKNFIRVLVAVLIALLTVPNVFAQDVYNNKMGIGTVNPAQKLEIAGNNTARIDALGTGGAYVVTPALTVPLLYVNNGNGDLYSMPSVSNSVIYISGGVPMWASGATAFSNLWNLTGGDNISVTYGTNFLGTTNNTQLQFKGIGYSGATTSTIGLIDPVNKNIYYGSYSTSGSAGGVTASALVSGSVDNVAIGSGAMGTAVANTSGNVFVGYLSGLLYKATTAGTGSVGIGSNALRYVTTGTPNTAFGYQAMGGTASFTTATNNLAMGYQSGYSHTTGTKDVSVGDYSLYNTSSSSNNVAVGNHALYTNSTSTGNNTAVGYYSQYTSSTGLGGNTSEGYYGDYDNTTGNRNVGIGYFTMEVSAGNSENVAVGNFAGRALNSISVANGPIVSIGDSAYYTATTSYKGVAIGFMALRALSVSPSTDVAIGYGVQQANSGSYDVAIGSQAWFKGTTSAQYTTVIGAGAGEGTGLTSENIAIGAGAMGSTNQSASDPYNIAIGSASSIITTPATTSSVNYGATFGNLSTGEYDLAIGSGAGYSLTSPQDNTFIGVNAAFNLTTGYYNTYIGYNAGYNATTPYYSTVIGANAIPNALIPYYTTVIGGNTQIQPSPTTYYSVIVGANANVAYGSVATSANYYNEAIGYGATAGVATGTASNYSAYNLAVGANANASTPATSGLSNLNSGTAIGYNAQALAANTVAIGANAYANTANTAILGSINGVNGATSSVNVGINKAAPAQALEVTAGTSTSGTIRVDGLNSSGNTYYKQTTTTSNIVYALNSTGDLYSLPNGTANQQLILNSSGAPTWGSASFSMTATYPLSNAGGSVPNFSLIGDTIGTVLLGRGGTTSRWDTTGAGAIGTVLSSVSAPDSIEWATISPTAGPNDNWGSQVAETDSSSLLLHTTITGNGTSSYPLRLAHQGAANGQTLAWSGTGFTWKPATFNTTLTTESIVPVSGSAVTVANGTNQVLGIGNVTLDLQGIAGGIFIGNGSSSATFTGAGTSGQVLTSNGATASWQPLNVPLPWALTGNSGIVPGTNFIGTLDDKQFRFYVGGISSTYTGNAGSLDPQLVSGTAYANTYLGAVVTTGNHGAGDNDQGSYNTGIGYATMAYTNSSATYDVALGAYALEGNGGTMSSAYSVAAGYRSMVGNSSGGSDETAIGYQTLGGVSSTTSNYNTAIGYQSMYGNNANATYYGSYDVAVGYNSLYNSTNSGGGASNTALGSLAEYQTTASTNTALGDSALYTNASGTLNTAIGYAANDSTSSLTNTTVLGAQSFAKQNNTLVLGSIANNNTAAASVNVGIGTNTPATDAGLAIKNNHLASQGSLAAGNVFADTAAGSGGSVGATLTASNDVGGTISFTAGIAGLNIGQMVTAYFGYPYDYAPIVVISPANAAAADAMTSNGAYVSASTSSFTINFDSAPTVGQTYSFNYFIIETPGTLAGAEPCSVPISITNSASSATPTNFQQMITVNSSAFSSYETTGLTNIEFSTGPSGTGTVLNAWLESVNNATYNQSTSTIYWVNLGSNTIASSGNLTIYMDFMSSATMTGTGGVMGEAPQLSGTYGQNDNGPLVFNFYDNFAGTTLNAVNWNSYISGSGTTVVNNGLTITSAATSSNTVNVISSTTSFGAIIAEAYVSGSATQSAARSYMPGLISNTATVEGTTMSDDNEPNCPTTSYVSFSNGRASSVTYTWLQGWNCYVGGNNGADYNVYNPGGGAQPLTVWSLGYVNSSTANDYLLQNYNLVANGTQAYNPTGNMYLSLGIQDDGGSLSTSLTAYWARTRQFVPNGGMPTASVGSLVTCTGSGSQPSEPNPCDIPITLINNQSTATLTGFQQMVVVNSSAYASDGENANLNNIEFSTGPQGTGTPLYAWIESGATSSSSSTIYWVNLGSTTIPANGSATIYMNIMSSPVMGVPTGATAYTGEAPQLSGTYAQYDNGGLVFPNVYTRWGALSGGSVPTTAGTGAINGGAIGIYNGSDLTITNNATSTTVTYNTGDVGSGIGVGYSTTPTSVTTYPNVLESDVTMTGYYMWFGTSNGEEEGGTGVNIDYDYPGFSSTDFGIKSNSQSFQYVMPTATLTSNPVVWSILEKDSVTIESILYNYTSAAGTFSGSTSHGTVNLYQPTYYGYFGTAQNGGTNQQTIYWTRTRTYPPLGVMPSTDFGSLSCCQPPNAPGSITGPTGTFCPGGTGTYSISSVIGAVSYDWSVPSGSTITSGQGTTSINVTFGYTSGTVSVTAINSCGAASGASYTAALTPSFTITVQPTNSSTSCTTGSVASFSVTATGGGLTYQWQVSTDGGVTWNNVSNGGIYSGATTATLTVTDPALTDNGYEYRCNVSGSCGGPASSNAATLNVYGNIPITITNSQSTATPTNFPEMLTINSSTYSAQEMSGLQNVEFTIGGPVGTGTPLQSWLESGNTNTSTSTIYWINLGSNTIAAGGSITIYMNFMSTNVLSATGPAGEAPQLSGSGANYALYDNGANIFEYYTNFAGTSLPSSLFVGAGTVTVNNGLTIPAASQNVNVVYSNGSWDYSQNILETYGRDNWPLANSGANDRFLVWNINNTTPTTAIYLCGGYYLYGTCTSNIPIITSGISGNNIFSIWSNSGLATGTCNYTTSATESYSCSAGSYYISLGTYSYGCYYQYLRVRTAPPGSVMPGSSMGSLTCCTTPPALGSISGSTGPFCPGATASYSVSSVAGASSYLWTVPTGATITSGQGTTSINVTYGNSGGNITVTAQNSCDLSGTASTLAVTNNFSITSQPANASTSCATGSTATFSVTATGTNTEQWQVSTDGGATWNNISNGGIYSGVTTTTLTVSNPPTADNGYEYRCVLTSVTCGGTLNSNAATLNVYGNVPITITNSQSTATPTNFPQMITVNSSSFSAQEMSGLQNVEFTIGGPAGTGTALQSWLESGNTNSSASTVYWVNLGSNTIPALGSVTIYMNFMSSNVLSALGPAGEAPQLSGTYAQYDNGALVFPSFYDNFTGTSLAAQWTSDGYQTVAVNNGVTLNYSSSNWNAIYTNTFSSALNNVAESYVEASNPSGTGACINTSGTNGNGINNGSDGVDAQLDGPSGSGYAFGTGGSCTTAPNANTTLATATPVANTFYVLSFYMLSTPVLQLNYGAFENVTGTGVSIGAISATSEVGLGVAQSSSGTYQWFRIRPNAPNSVMPTASIGSLSCCTAAPAVGSITGSTGPFCPGATATYSISSVVGASSYVWTVPTGATITSGQGTTSINVTYGNAGGNISVAAENICSLVGTASTLAVTSSFSITSQPVNASTSCATGGTVTFSVTATGTNTYQWQVDSTSSWSNITTSRNGVYSNYTTSTLTVASPPFSMNGYQYRCVITSVTCGGTLTSSAATLGVLGNIPITLTNSQSTATSANFEQMLTVNSSNYTAQELSGLQNVEFSVGGPIGDGGTALESWLESGNTNTSTSTVYWVNLGTNTISANGTLTIYMNFMPTSILNSAGPAGEAPDLSTPYAQYDNGGLVFPNVYTRWGGNTGGVLPTTGGTGAINGGGITKAGYNCTSTISSSYPTITNFTTYTQVQFTGSCNSNNPGLPNENVNGVYYSATPSSSYVYPTVLESKVNIGDTYSWFGTGYGQEEEGMGAIVANDNNNGSQPYYSVRSDFNYEGNGTDCATTPNTYDNVNDYSNLSEPNTSPYVWSLLLNWNGTNDQITNCLYNYTQIPSITFPIDIDGNGASNDETGCTLTTLFGYFGTLQNGSNSEPYEQIYWTRTRQFPPSGVMPTATYYSMTCCNTPTTPGSISSTPTTTTFCPGTTATYSISAVAGASSYVWTVPSGSTINSGQGTTSLNVTLGANSGNVSVATTNSCGEESSASTYAVTSLTSFITQPSNAGISCAHVGTQNATFTVNVSGATAWQWQVDSTGTWSNITTSRNGVYSNYTTATLTLTDPPISMNGYQYRCIVTTASCGAATSNSATLTVSTLNSVPITITNNGTTATPANFQEMLTINFSTYSSASPAVQANCNNVLFSTGASGTGNILYAWFENGTSGTYPAVAPANTSTSAVVWVNLGSLTVAGSGGTQTIYMTFEPSAVMGVPTGATAYTGEAPELTVTYGQYDNGAEVFNSFYDNFAGSSLDANWSTPYSTGNGTLTVNNGLTISTPAQATNVMAVNLITSTNSFAANCVAEAYASGSSAVSASRSYMPGLTSLQATTEGFPITDYYNSYASQDNPYNYLCFSNGRAAFADYSWLQGTSTSPSPYNDYNEYTVGGSEPYGVYGLYYDGGPNYLYIDYAYETTGNVNGGGPNFAPTGGALYFAMAQAGYSACPSAQTLTSYWTRIRQYPPLVSTVPTNPPATFGSYGCH